MATTYEILSRAGQNIKNAVTENYASFVNMTQTIGEPIKQIATGYVADLTNVTVSARETFTKFNTLSEDDKKAVLDYVGKNRNASINFDTFNAFRQTPGMSADGAVALANETIVPQPIAAGMIQAGQSANESKAAAGESKTAQGKAETAQGRAEIAQKSSEAAAETSVDAANTSINAANTSTNAANTGINAANTAQNAAVAAGASATNAKDAEQRSGINKRDAETSVAGAKLSASIASGFSKDAENARDGAINARGGAEKAQWKTELAASAVSLDAYNVALNRQAEHNERVELPKQVGALRGKAEDLSNEIKKLSGLSMALLNDKNSIAYQEIYDYGKGKSDETKSDKTKANTLKWKDGNAVIDGNGVFVIKPLKGKATIGSNLTIEKMDQGDIVQIDTTHLNDNQTIKRAADKRNFGHGKIMLVAKEGDSLDVKDIPGGVVVKIGEKAVKLDGFSREDIMLGTGQNGQVNGRVASLNKWMTTLESDHQKKMDGALAQYNDQRAMVIKAADVDFDKNKGVSNGITSNEAEAALRAIKRNDKHDGGEFNTTAGPVTRVFEKIRASGGMTVEGALKQLDLEIKVQQDLPKSAPIGAKQGQGHTGGH